MLYEEVTEDSNFRSFFRVLMNLRKGAKLENDSLSAIMTSEYSRKHVVFQLKDTQSKNIVKTEN